MEGKATAGGTVQSRERKGKKCSACFPLPSCLPAIPSWSQLASVSGKVVAWGVGRWGKWEKVQGVDQIAHRQPPSTGAQVWGWAGGDSLVPTGGHRLMDPTGARSKTSPRGKEPGALAFPGFSKAGAREPCVCVCVGGGVTALWPTGRSGTPRGGGILSRMRALC